MNVSTSALLGLLVDEIASPSGAVAKVLEDIAKLLALPPGANVDDILKAIGALGDELDGEEAPADGGAPADPLAASPDPPPAELSRGTARRAPAAGRTFTTSRGVVTLSASEIESCKEAGAKLEAYAENKATREAARLGRTRKPLATLTHDAKPDADGFVANPSAAFPTTPEQQKKWLDDRAAQRGKRAARTASTPQARGYDRAVKDAQATRAEQARRR